MQTLEELHPMTILLYFLAVTGITMFSMHPAVLGCSLFGAVLYFIVRNGRKHFKRHIFSGILFLMLTLINPLVSHNGVTVLFVLNDNPITLEALLYGADSALMITAVLYWIGSFSQIMTSEKILCIFGKFSPKIALMLSMTLRFVPLLNRQSKNISDTQKALGYYQSDNIIDSIREKAKIFDIVITWALENGIITAESMDARGANLGRRTSFSIHHIRKEDVFFIIILALLTGITVSVLLLHMLSAEFYPSVSLPEYRIENLTGILTFLGLALMPSILQAEVSLKWKYLQSKI
ncbi:MAG: cobalt transport protein [Oscillospiraceae bacterium]|nr:cobalt transport protein [Oscillospiraceae bacterium]